MPPESDGDERRHRTLVQCGQHHGSFAEFTIPGAQVASGILQRVLAARDGCGEGVWAGAAPRATPADALVATAAHARIESVCAGVARLEQAHGQRPTTATCAVRVDNGQRPTTTATCARVRVAKDGQRPATASLHFPHRESMQPPFTATNRFTKYVL